MRRLAFGAICMVVVLAACSDDLFSVNETSEAASAKAASADAAAEPEPATSSATERVNPLGSGTPMTGTVSGLVGQITAFKVEETATSTIVQLAADVLFAFDSANLGPGAAEQLRRTAELIGRGGPGDIAIVGHTDSKGTDAYNNELSLQRARAVASWLSAQGSVAAGRLKPDGRGKTEPVVSNTTPTGADDPNGRSRNRRVVVVIPRAA